MDDSVEMVADDYFPHPGDSHSGAVGGGGLGHGEDGASVMLAVLGAVWHLARGLLIPGEEGAALVSEEVLGHLTQAALGLLQWPAAWRAAALSSTAWVGVGVSAALLACLLATHVRYRVYTAELRRLERAYPWDADDAD